MLRADKQGKKEDKNRITRGTIEKENICIGNEWQKDLERRGNGKKRTKQNVGMEMREEKKNFCDRHESGD